jgi:hypothetical protein
MASSAPLPHGRHDAALFWTALCCCLGVICAVPRRAISADLEIHEVQAEVDRYLAEPVRLVGRFQSASSGHLLLVDSEIDFRLGDQNHRLRSGLESIRLTGRLRREGSQLVFDVTRLEEVPTEAQRFQQRRDRLKPEDYKQLYELSRWIRLRAQWYDDPSLLEMAWKSYREAFSWEEALLVASSDAEGLLELAQRGERLALEPREVTRLRHDALWIMKRTLAEDDAQGRRKLADTVEQLLPGAVPLQATGSAAQNPALTEQQSEQHAEQPSQQQAEYFNDPQAEFARASNSRRQTMARWFWVGCFSEALEITAATDDADLMALAREAANRLPERNDLQQRLRLMSVRRETADVKELSRRRVLVLEASLVEMKQAQEGRQLVVDWLKLQRRQLDNDDAEQRVRLADDYRLLLQDDETAAELYLEAVELAPDFRQATEALTELGYQRISDRWQKTSGRTASEISRQRQEENGQLKVGDHLQDVYRRLGQPDRVARTLTTQGVVEQLIFDGPPALYIYVRRTRAQPEGWVIAISAP